jgi:hypothetical protein
MLFAVDPLLHRIDALPEHGCYSVTFLIDASHERSVVMKVTGDDLADVVAPEANMLPGWSVESESNRTVLEAVVAFHRARTRADSGGAVLRDVPGGWDVSVGNVALDENGRPACAAHGELEVAEASNGSATTFVCATCGACARFGDEAD